MPSPQGGPHASRERTLLRRFQKSGAQHQQAAARSSSPRAGHRELFLDGNALLHSTYTGTTAAGCSLGGQGQFRGFRGSKSERWSAAIGARA